MKIPFLQNNKEDIKNFFFRFIQIAFRQGVLFGFTLISAKLLFPDEFARISYLMALTIFFSTIAETGFSFSVSKFVAEDALEYKRGNTILATSFLCLLVFFLVTSVGFYTVSKLTNSSGQGVQLVLLSSLLFLIPAVSVFDGLFRGLRKFRSLTYINLISGTLACLPFVFLIQRFQGVGVIAAYVVLYLFCFLCSTAWYVYFYSEDNGGYVWNGAIAKKISLYSLQLGVASLGYFLFSRFSILVLGHFSFLKETALYELILKFEMIFLLPSFIIGHVLAPKMTVLYRQDTAAFLQNFKKGYLYSCLYSIVTSAVYFLLLYGVFHFFYAEYLIDSFFLILGISAFTFFIKCYSAVLDFSFIIASGYGKVTARVYPIVGFANVILCYVFAERLGPVGILSLVLLSHVLMIAILHPFVYLKFKKEVAHAKA